MSVSVLVDKTHIPNEEDVSRVLGKAKLLWDEIRAHVASEYPPLVEEWGSSGKKYGWFLRLIHKKRTIVYLIPGEGLFLCGFVLGEKAVALARTRSLPSTVMEKIEQAPRYAEGRGIRLQVKTRKDVAAIKELVNIKMAS